MKLTFLLIAIFNLIFIFSVLKVAKQSDEEMEKKYYEDCKRENKSKITSAFYSDGDSLYTVITEDFKQINIKDKSRFDEILREGFIDE